MVGVPRLYDGTDLRSSYVIWQEGVDPFVVVELLPPGTEREDSGYAAPAEGASVIASPGLGSRTDSAQAVGDEATGEIPKKWEVYEQILRVPYYIVFSRYTDRLHFFQLTGGRYQEQPVDPNHPRIWISELCLGLGLWQGEFKGVSRQWLRWYDNQGSWIPTDAERATQAEAQLDQVALNLLQQGMTVEQVAQIMGLSLEKVQAIAKNIT